ncbi:hypothetical protein H0X09_00795 [Candidatus Saccharibacteria bacterium]|nr:hypothetical protein [Candidatus Saccharibacteria bacterium]
MTKREEGGFTITELTISVTIAGFLAAILFIVTFYYYANVIQSEVSTEMALGSQSILAQMTDDIRLADAIASTNLLADANQPGGGWATNDPSNILIIESPAVTSARDIIFDPDTGFPYRNEYIYFTSGNNMYKRVLANTAATGNTAVTTCPTALATPSCPPDRLLSNLVSNVSFTFYDSSNVTTADASQARSVTLNIDMAKKAFGKNVTLSNATRITLRNQ